MPDEYQQSPHIRKVKGDANYHYHEAPPIQSRHLSRGKWGWVIGLAAVAVSAGAMANTQLNAQAVYYCASHNTVKYHTDATCYHLQQCGAVVKSMSLGQAKDKMEQCKSCH